MAKAWERVLMSKKGGEFLKKEGKRVGSSVLIREKVGSRKGRSAIDHHYTGNSRLMRATSRRGEGKRLREER